MKRTLTLLLLMAHVGLVTGGVVSPHRGASGDPMGCHNMSEPVAWETVGPPSECGHCPVDECASMARCASAVTAMIATAHVPFVEEFVPDWEGELPSGEPTAAVPPILPPPRA